MAQDPHQEIIQHNRVYLVGHLDLLNTLVLDRLVERGVLSSLQLTSMRESQGNSNIQLSEALLGHLYRRPYTDWQEFLSCLVESGQGHIVEHLKNPHRDGPSGKVILDLQQKMAARIKKFYDNVPLWTLHSDRVAIPMDDIYVRLELVKEKQRKHGKEQTLQSYKELLRKEEDSGTVYLTGEPGVGKSTLVNRICVDWALAKMDKEQTADEIFEQYLFVLPIFLRDVRASQTLRQVIANEYQLHEIEAEALCRCIENPQNTILLILDGMDEYNENTSTEITEIIHRKRLPHVTLFITSRFSSESVFGDKKPGRCTEVRLQGFSEAGVKEYIKRFFDEQKEEGDALLTEIKKTEELVHHSHIPAILLMMATLWEEYQQLPSTIVGFYEEFVAYVFARMEKKIKNMADRAKSTEEILKRYNTQIMALGCLATGNVKTHKLELKFKREDVNKNISPEDLNNGFILQKCTFTREIFYIFIHKTLQEFFLAYYLVHSDKSTQQELLLRFFNSRQAFMESAMIRRFVSGLGGEEIHQKLERMIKGSEWEVARMHTALQLEYLAEHQDATLTLPRGVMLDLTDRRYPASHYVRYLTQDGGEVRRMWVTTRDVRLWRLLQHLHAPQLTCLQLYRSSWPPCSVDKQYITQTLDRTLTKFSLKQLTVIDQDDDNEVSAVVRAVVQTQTIQVLTLHLTRLTGDRIQTLTEWLPGCHLTSLKMSDCYLTSQEMMAALSVLPPSLQTLNVSCNNLTGLTDTGQMSGVTRSQIQTLNMSACHLTSQEMMAALSVLPPSLQTLNVRGNDLRGLTDTGQWSGVTRSQIQTLNISFCHLTSRGVLAVIDAAPETLTDLDVSVNCREGEGDDLVKVTERTTQLNKLKTLNLENNRMSRDVVRTIKQKLTETCPHLELTIDVQR